ncbi:MAG: phosphoribosyltransferase family protein [Pyrobaculum sp.]
MKRVEGLRLQLDAVAYLKAVKRLLGVTYRELTRLLDIPESVLSRYAIGDMLPSVETAREILEKLVERYPISEVVKAKFKTFDTYIDMSFVSLPEFWKIYEIYLWQRFRGLEVDKVLTAAVDGIPLAVAAASRFEAPLVVAKAYREPGVDNYEYTYLREGRPVTLYIPTAQLRPGEKVLIVDDIARSGKTLRALAGLTERAGAVVAAASVLVARRGLELSANFPVDMLYIY